MNFYDVHYENGRVSNGKGIDLPVIEPDKKLLDENGYDSKEIVFGIRPEDLQAEQIALETSPNTVIRADIEVAELTGADSILHLKSNETEITAVVDARDHHQPGTQIDVAVNMNKARFFDKDTEKAISKVKKSERKTVNV